MQHAKQALLSRGAAEHTFLGEEASARERLGERLVEYSPAHPGQYFSRRFMQMSRPILPIDHSTRENRQSVSIVLTDLQLGQILAFLFLVAS